MTNFIPSKYQQAIKAWLDSVLLFLTGGAPVSSVIVNAVPGSGKTTTLVWLAGFVPKGTKLAFLSFGRDIVATLAKRCPDAFCKTYNALGSQAIRAKLAGRWIKLHDGRKVPNKSLCILWDMFPKDDKGERDKEYFTYSRFVTRLVSLAKNAGIGALMPDTYEAWKRIIVYHSLSLDSKAAKEERAIEIAQDVLRISNEWSKQGKIDFDDQLYLVALWDLALPSFDLILVDEFQDTNAIQCAMLQRMARQDGKTRYLLVGDDKQAIYGFRGADAQAMAKAVTMFNAKPLPLSICYRCSKAVVSNANRIFPDVGMLADDSAAQGKVETLDGYSADTFNATDAILCRNTAPLVKLAHKFILNRIPCHILGRELGAGLVALVDKMDAADITDLQAKVEEFQTRETSRLLEKSREAEAEAVNDQCDCIRLFISNLSESGRTIDALKASITDLFSDREGCLTLATIHKSKGLEWERVFILDSHLMPSKYAKQEWQLEQEKNLQWVANTRAKLDLFYITSDCWE